MADTADRPELRALREGLRRRRDAALRLPPLKCGCRDPLSQRHRLGKCRWPWKGSTR
jgi:hypothetical protein